MKSVNEAHRPHASASRPAAGRRRLLTGVGGMAIALAGAFPSLAWADDYPVNSQADLIAAINTLNGNADLTPRIVLGASFTLTTTAIPLPTKPVTIDMQGFQINGGGNNVGFIGPFASGTLTLNGTITGASALQFDSQITSGNAGLVVNKGTIAAAASAGVGANPGVGVNLTNLLTFENSGTITGGTANAYVRPNGGSTAGSGISIFSGATVINDADGTIQGGNSQGIGAGAGIYSRNASNASFIQNTGQIFGGSDVTGVSAGSVAIGGTGLAGATITNTGTITGGNNAAAIGLVGINPWNVTVINDGTISSGTVGGNAIDMGTNAAGQLILELRSGSVINGNVIASSTGAVDYLRLGGSVDSSFDVTQIGAGAKYRNFEFFQKTGTSTWTLTGDSGRLGWNIVQGTLMIGDGATTGPQLGGVINNGTLIFNQTGTQNIDALAGASIGGSGSVVQNGAGITILGGINSYTGGTTLNNGVLQIFSDGSLGNGGALTINGGTLRYVGTSGSISRTINWGANGATFDITASNGSLSVSPLMNGGALTKVGLGTLILNGDNTYIGGTTISAGGLTVTGSILGNVLNNGTLSFGNSANYTYAGTITGSGNLSASGTGILTLTGNSTYSGSTSIASVNGQLRIAGGAQVLSGGATTFGRATLTVDGAGTLFRTTALSGTITTSGSTAVNVTNGGTLQLTVGDFNLRGLGAGVPQLNISGANSLLDVKLGIKGGVLGNSAFGLNLSGGGALHTGGTSQIGTATTTSPITVAITGAGTNWTSGGSLLMTSGSFSLNQGATASFTNATFGAAASATSVTVSDAGSQLATTTGDLVIGSGAGASALTLSNGGAVNVAGSLVLASTGTATGILNIGGAEAQAATGTGSFNVATLNLGSATSRINFNHTDTNYLFGAAVSGAGAINQVAGDTNMTGNSALFTGTTNVSGGSLRVNGTLGGAGSAVNVLIGGRLGGAGTIGGNVTVAGGTLAPGNSPGTLTINGNLALSAGSTLAYEFGQKNVAGGAFNDLVNVGGNLTLDGTINVAVPTGGSFDLGIYRIINYAGALTDNGLTIGTLPAGTTGVIQTSVAGQVNLLNTGGALLNFWDGDAAGNAFNGAIDGGNGSWLASTGTAWADATGAVNASYANGAFAIFTGASGVVTIDNSLGAVTTSGMQFASDGYRLSGDTLTLSGPQAVIRVGDGSAAGGGYTATIDAAIAGAAQLVKTDAGTLVLGGTNSYTGGTAINGGTLQIASDANLGAVTGGLSFNGGTLATTADISSARAIDLAGQGMFSTGAGTTLTLTGAISGAGNLGKADSGTLILAGTGSFTGGTTVTQGTLLVNGNYAAASGLTNVGAAAALGGTGTIGGDVRVSGTLAPGAGGAGTLTIAGNLTLASTATLAYDFGQANVGGGALNDLVNVGGNLVLGGTVNVSVPTGGSFGPGVYRLFNYGGTLTDNGLTLGGVPAGSNVAVQTSVGGQVNLINFAGLSLNFWDGVAGPKNNAAINGGSGVWQNSTGNDNWTDANGLVNAAYSDASFAVFGGTAGTVTVDNSLGAVSAAGMQFAANGYTLTGGAITLTGPQAVIRVGDGSAAGAGFVATINAALSGSAQLVKTDAGTLVLGGTNNYTGGTAINGGTLQIASDASLGAASGGVSFDGGTLATSATLTSNRTVALAGTGTIATANATTFTLAGALSGTGALTKAGAGTLLLTGDSSGYAGATHVAAGTLAVTGALGGTMTVGSGARLEGTGSVGAVTNFGVVAPGRDSFGTLTMASYAGAGGRLEIRTALGGDASPTDRLVTGTTAGTTTIDVINRGGLGAQTVEGVKIVDVTGASNGTFLLRGDYVFGGEQAVIAGAYGYRLYKGGVSTPTDGDWYLRSSLLATPEQPQVPLYQPGVPVYEAYGQTLLALTDVGTMQQRTGNRQWAATESGKPSGIWGRMQAGRSRPNATVTTSLADVNVDSWKMEIGADHVLSERGDGASLVLGVLGSYGEANANVASLYGNGAIKTKGYGAGATLTWFGPAGFYVDSRAQLTWFDSRLRSALLGTLADGNRGFGQAYSLEVGKRAPVGGKLSVTPQIQMVYQHVGFDRFTDPNDATVSSGRGGSLKSRWGLSVDRQDARSYVYGVANLSYEWLDGMVTDVSGTPIRRENHRLWGELGVGGSALIGNRVTLFTEASANTAINDFGKSYSVKGTAGLRLAF